MNGCYQSFTIASKGGTVSSGDFKGIVSFSLQNTSAFVGFATNGCFDDTSVEAGPCASADDTGPDYIFECYKQQTGFDLPCSDGNSVTSNSAISSGTATVTSKDFGGVTQVVGTVNFGGIVVTAAVIGSGEPFARLPIGNCSKSLGCGPTAGQAWNYSGNLIADGWELNNGSCRRLLDTWEDTDVGYPGSVSVGGGFSAFEEYRGFLVYNDPLAPYGFMRSDPCTVKNVFVYDYQAIDEGGAFDAWASLNSILPSVFRIINPDGTLSPDPSPPIRFHQLTADRVDASAPPASGPSLPTIRALNRGTMRDPILGSQWHNAFPIGFVADPAPTALHSNTTLAQRSGGFANDGGPIIVNYQNIVTAAQAAQTMGTPTSVQVSLAETLIHETGHKMGLPHVLRLQRNFVAFPGVVPGASRPLAVGVGSFTVDSAVPQNVYARTSYYLGKVFAEFIAFDSPSYDQPQTACSGVPLAITGIAQLDGTFSLAANAWVDPTTQTWISRATVQTTTGPITCNSGANAGLPLGIATFDQPVGPQNPPVFNIMNFTMNLNAGNATSNFIFSATARTQLCAKSTCP